MTHLYVRATLVQVPDGQIVQVASLPPGPKNSPKMIDLLVYGSFMVLAVFSVWMLLPN